VSQLAHASPHPRRRRPRRGGTLALFAGPPVLWLLLFVIVPYSGILVFSFWKTDYVDLIPAFTWSNLDRLVTDPIVRTVALRSLWIALVVTAATFAISFPLAYLGAFHVKRKKLFVFLVIAPMWVSYIVRLYSWRLLLGDDGVINEGLRAVGLISRPIDALLFSPFAVVVTLTYVYMPFMFVSLFSVLEGLDERTLRAASDLYANPVKRFFAVTLPLTKPGIAAGVMFVFPLTFGDYIAPSLVGGTSSQMIANLIQNQFGVTFDWPFGAALALGLLAVVMSALWVLERWRNVEDVRVF